MRPQPACCSYVCCAVAKVTDRGGQWRKVQDGSAAIFGPCAVAFGLHEEEADGSSGVADVAKPFPKPRPRASAAAPTLPRPRGIICRPKRYSFPIELIRGVVGWRNLERRGLISYLAAGTRTLGTCRRKEHRMGPPGASSHHAQAHEGRVEDPRIEPHVPAHAAPGNPSLIILEDMSDSGGSGFRLQPGGD